MVPEDLLHAVSVQTLTNLLRGQVHFAGMMEYDGELHIPRNYLVPPPNIKNTSGEYLAHNGISTFV